MVEQGQDLPPEVRMALQQGRKIEAIKLLRELQRVGLKEAKEAVDGHALESQPGNVSVVQPGGRNAVFWCLGLLGLGVVVAWFLGGS